MKLTPDERTAALATFAEYFVKNYPGPHTIIGDPNWHAPKVFRAALHAIESESKCDRDKLMERSVGAMAIAEGELGWEKVPIDCPMLEAVAKLRKDFDRLERSDYLSSRNE